MQSTDIAACLLTTDPLPLDERARLESLGLARLDVLRRLALVWAELLGDDLVTQQLLPAILDHLLAAPDPDWAALALSRLQADLGGVTLAHRLLDDPRCAHDLIYVLGLGSFPAQLLVRDPGLADLLSAHDALAAELEPEALTRAALAQTARLTNLEARRNALRRFKREQFLRVIAQDFLLSHPQREVTAAVSAVADACCRAALAAAVHDVLGPEADPARGLAVIAMGKWGSRELNYNSDIDLICVYDQARAGYSAEQWEEVVRALSDELAATTSEGTVFRVDLRLRPEGDGSALVRSLESCISYYETVGAAWETLALTRARCCAGDAELGRAFEELAQRLAFGTRVRQAGIEAIRRNRRDLDARSDAQRNVKEGAGGIRDVEFTAQLLQLVHGVTDPTVRERNTWDALAALQRAGAISSRERRTLAEGYDLLRRVEHLLQLQPTSPTQVLPTARPAMRRLARALGFRDAGPVAAGDRFLAEYRSHTSAVRELSERLFFNPIPLTSPDSGQHVQELLDPLADDAEVLAHLAMIPFADPREARRRLLFLAHGQPPMRLDPEIQRLFVEFLPALLACVQRMPDPDASLRWFERFVASAGGRELAYGYFLSHPPVIELLCRIGGYSQALSRTLVDHPEYLDRAVLASYASRDPELSDLFDEAHHRLAPLKRPEARLDDLRRFRRREVFRIGVRDLLGVNEVEQVTAQLSDVAEVALGLLYEEVRASVAGADELPFAVIGLGKLGGRELHYNSDLDVLWVYDGAGSPEVAERLAQTLTRAAQETTRAGRLFELDAKLRPYGANSPLTSTVESYAAYLARKAEPWERLALSRARCVAGDAAVGRRFLDVAHGFAYGPPPTAAELEHLRHIKRRIETERLDTSDAAHIDLKLEPGGIMDVEYLTQTLLITHGHELPAVRGANTPNALRALAEAGVLPRAEAELLLRNFLALRRYELRLQLVLDRPGALLPTDPDGLAATAKRLGWSTHEAMTRPGQLVGDLRVQLGAVREVVVRRLGL